MAVRDAERLLRHSEMLLALFKPFSSSRYTDLDWNAVADEVDYLRQQVGVVQHHDAITGTMTLLTRQDYYNRLSNGTARVNDQLRRLMSLVLMEKSSTANIDIVYDPTGLVQDIDKGMVPVVLFNNLGWRRSEYVRVPVTRPDLTVVTMNEDETVTSAVSVEAIARGPNQYDLYFVAEMPPLGYSTYFIMANATTQIQANVVRPTSTLDATVTLENDALLVTFTLTNGQLPYVLSSVTNKRTQNALPISQVYAQYQSDGDGAYIFHPAGPASPYPVDPAQVKFNVIKGEKIQEFSQTLSNNLTQVFRLYASKSGDSGISDFIEFTTNVKLADDKEMVARFDAPSMKTNGVFYTDNYGFEVIKRQYQSRYGDLNVASMIAGNYYPMVASSFIRDAANQITILSKQSMGASSQFDGSLEVMINRNTLTDDGRGVGQNVNESDWVGVTLRIIVSDPGSSETIRPLISKRFENNVWQAYVSNANKNNDLKSFANEVQTMFTPLSENGLPSNLHLLSLMLLPKNNTSGEHLTVLRLQHLYEVGQDQVYAKQERLQVRGLFDSSMYTIDNYKEKTLSLNFDKPLTTTANLDLTVNPGELRTFTMQLGTVGRSFWSLESFMIGIVVCVGVIALFTVMIFLVKQFVMAQKQSKGEDLESAEKTALLQQKNVNK